jgi:hypothetical protein
MAHMGFELFAISAVTVLLLSSVRWSGVEGLSRMGTRLEE